MVTVTKYVWDPVFDSVSHGLDENNDVKAVYLLRAELMSYFWPNCECRDLSPVSVGWPNCREFRRDVLVGARWELRWRACSGRFSCSNVWRCPSCHRSFRTAVIFSAERAPRRGTVSIVQAGSTAVVLRNAIVRVQCVTSC